MNVSERVRGGGGERERERKKYKNRKREIGSTSKLSHCREKLAFLKSL